MQHSAPCQGKTIVTEGPSLTSFIDESRGSKIGRRKSSNRLLQLSEIVSLALYFDRSHECKHLPVPQAIEIEHNTCN